MCPFEFAIKHPEIKLPQFDRNDKDFAPYLNYMNAQANVENKNTANMVNCNYSEAMTETVQGGQTNQVDPRQKQAMM